MASTRVGSVPPRLSFAKVAAMNVPTSPKASHPFTEEKRTQIKESTNRRSTVISPKPELPFPQAKPQRTEADAAANTPHLHGNDVAIEGLSLVGHMSLGTNGIKGAESADSIEDDQSHLSNSSTKQQSFETKSMASVTTFAMDEKESLRPDDSASVRAVDDDDLASTVSRNATLQQESSVIMPTLRGGAGANGPSISVATRRYPTLTNPPRFGDLEPPTAPPSEVSQVPSSTAATEQLDEPSLRVPPPPVSPDEKLLDALASPKDRLSILQLEEHVLGFIAQSSVEFIDLPPQNSYARLLAHKLADYYSLLHRINEDGTSIRIFRTSTSNLPTPLTVLAQSIPVGSVQSLPTAVKIMRRAGIGPRQLSTTNSTAPSSSAPSKATSEAGHSEEGVISPTEVSTPSRDKSKMTREEREAQYKAARERIFGDFQELSIGEHVSTGENSASLSRSSSSSGKRKTRRQKAPKDDSFDSRSAFVPGYGGLHVQPVQTPVPPQQYLEQAYHHQYEASASGYSQNVNYGTTPTQVYPGFDQNMTISSPATFSPMSPQGFNMIENWPNTQAQNVGNYFNYPQAQGNYQQNVQQVVPQMNHQYLQHPQPVMQQSLGWPNTQFHNPYHQQMNLALAAPSWGNFQPQQYGQVQNQVGANFAVNPQTVLPNNFNRPLFNPQTRSFVPGTNSTRSGPKNGRKKHSPAPPNQPQSRNSSGTKSYASSTPSTATTMPPKGPIPELGRSISSSSFLRAGEESLQKKYGTPANLPKKPPATQVQSQFDAGSINTVKNPNGSMPGTGSMHAIDAAESGGAGVEAQGTIPLA